MSVLAKIAAALWWGLVPAVVAGILAIWHYATDTQGIVIGLVIAAVILVPLAAYLLWPGRDHAHDDPDAAEEHMKPLRQPGQAEHTLTADLWQRGMLLRPRGLDPRRAAVLARKVVSRTARARIARTPRPAGRHAAPGKPLGISGSSQAAARHPHHGGRPAPPPLMIVAGGGLEVAPAEPAPPLPELPASASAADRSLHEPAMPLELPGEIDPTAFPAWETGGFAAVDAELVRRASDAA